MSNTLETENRRSLAHRVVVRISLALVFVAAGSLATGASLVATAPPAGAFCDPEPIYGEWENVAETQLVDRVDLDFACFDFLDPNGQTYGRTGFVIRLWNTCKSPAPCDWGSAELDPYDLNGDTWYRATYTDRLATVHVWVRPYDSQLRVWTWIDFHGDIPDVATDDWLTRSAP